MAAYFNLTLDTVAPAGVKVVIDGGDLYTASTTANLAISCSDTSTTGYTMKIYGSVVDAATAEEAKWENFATTKQINLASGDGLKTINVIVRDDVWNESTVATATITLNTAVPVVTIVGPDRTKISLVSGRNTSIFTFTSDQDYEEYKVCVVPNSNSAQDAGDVIPTDGGSINTSGTGTFTGSENLQVTINGTDFSSVISGTNDPQVIKVFVKNAAGTWSN